MTTELEIIDTVVKIGLGALISALATYFVTSKSHRHEIKKNLSNDKKTLLIEATRKIDRSNELKNKAAFSIWQKAKAGEDDEIKEEISLIWDAGSELKNAISNAHLIGYPELAELIGQLHESLNELQKHYSKHGIEYDEEFVENNTANRKNIHNILHVEYSKIFTAIHV